MENFVKKVLVVLCMVILLGNSVATQAEATAGDSISILKMVTATVPTEAKREANDGAETLTTFEAGADILVVEEVDEEWYSIAYKGEIGYVKKADTKDKETDVEAIDEELSLEEYESNLLVEEVERDRTESRRRIMWGVIIGILVVAIFAVGIISNVMGKGKEEAREDTKDSSVSEKKK